MVFPFENGNDSMTETEDRGGPLPLNPSCVTNYAKIDDCISIHRHGISRVVRTDDAPDVSVASLSSFRTRSSLLICKRVYGADAAGREL